MIDAEEFAQRFAEIKARSRAETAPSPLVELASTGRLDEFLDGRGPVDWTRLPWLWRGGHARPKQLAPPGDWLAWLFLAGRGAGKTRSGSEWVREREEAGARRIAFLGPTRGEIKKVMVQGDSGILAVYPPWERPIWLENDGEVHFKCRHCGRYDCDQGAVAYACTAEKPELRGGNYDTAWGDEPILWPYLDVLWINLLLALRRRVRGLRPQACITSTPRPIEWLRRLIMSGTTHTTHGLSTENTAQPTSWHREMADMLGGTRQGAQELEAEILGDNPDALFSQSVINVHRVSEAPKLERIVVAIDPAVSTNKKSDFTGIVVVGFAKGESYVLADATAKYTPEQWGDKAFALFDAWGADAFVVERNRAGDLPKSNLRAVARQRQQSEPPIEEVLALGDKGSRAMPVSTLYTKGRAHHVGSLPRLEAEMTSWDHTTGVSPNGLDALVHAIRHLTKIGEEPEPKKPDPRAPWKGYVAYARRQPAAPARTI